MNPDGASQEQTRFGGRGPIAAIVGLVILTVYTFSVSMVPIRTDNDCWWHVKSGWYISQHGLPETDVFSYTAADHVWHNHEWLTQIVFYKVWQLGDATGFDGWRAVILLKSIILWACYGLVYLLAGRISRNWWVALLVAVLAVAIGRRTFYPRPPVVSNLLLIIQIGLLTAVCEGWLRRAWVFALVPIIALWTNLHGGWMAGGVVLSAFTADQVYSALRHRLPRMPFAVPDHIVPIKWLLILLPLCLLATLANPFGYGLYALPGRVLGDTALVRSIGELQPPDFFYVIDFELAIHGAFLLALCTTRFRPRLFEVLIYLFFLHQAIQHVRHLLLFSVMMVPLYARLAGAVVESAGVSLAEWREGRGAALRPVPAIAAGMLALATAGWVIVNPREGGRVVELFNRRTFPSTYTQRNLQYADGTGYVRDRFPATLCDYIELAGLEGNMFNENFYAGYVLWRLSPDKHKVFSDPRFDIFGGEIWRSERIIADGGEQAILAFDETGQPVYTSWSKELDRWDIQWAIVRSGTGLEWRLLQSDDAWAPVVEWAGAPWQVWVRNTPENAAMIRNARATAPLAGGIAPPRD